MAPHKPIRSDPHRSDPIASHKPKRHRAERHPTAPHRAAPHLAEPHRTDSSGADPNGTARAETNGTAHRRSASIRPASHRLDRHRTEPCDIPRAAPHHTARSCFTPARAAPHRAASSRTASSRAEPHRAEPHRLPRRAEPDPRPAGQLSLSPPAPPPTNPRSQQPSTTHAATNGRHFGPPLTQLPATPQTPPSPDARPPTNHPSTQQKTSSRATQRVAQQRTAVAGSRSSTGHSTRRPAKRPCRGSQHSGHVKDGRRRTERPHFPRSDAAPTPADSPSGTDTRPGTAGAGSIDSPHTPWSPRSGAGHHEGARSEHL